MKSPTPFIIPLASFAAGIYLQSLLHVPTLPITSFFVALLIIFICLRNKTTFTRFIIPSLFFTAGALLLSLQYYQTATLRNELANKKLNLIATITDKTFKDGFKKGEIIELSVTHPAACKIVCYTHYPTHMRVGDIFEFKNVEIPTKKATTMTGNPTFDDYMIKENVVATIFMNKNIKYKLKERPAYSFNRWLWQKRQQLYWALKKKLPKQTFMYFSLIFLGNKQHDAIDQLRKSFNAWGLAHYLARSGLHIVLFIIIWQWILSLIPIHLYFKRILLIIICTIYGFLSWYSIPFARAYYAFLLIETGRLCNRQTYYLHILTLICTLILLSNPMQLFFLDFQLTFALTFALVWIGQITNRRSPEVNASG